MRPRLFRLFVLTALACAASRCALAESGISAKLHPWGLFNPGAWKTVRVATETLNDQGQVVSTSTTDTKTVLIDLDNGGVTLEIQACIEVAGKRFRAEPQTVKQGFHGELVGPNLRIKGPTDASVTIEGQEIPCKLEQVECVVSNGKTVTKIYYSSTVAPYILKRESVTTDPEGKTVLSETAVDVTTLNMPVEVLGEMKNVSQIKTVHRSGNGTVTTWADVLPEVPGGVVGNSSKETDKSGRLVRRSTLKLIDYSDSPEKDRGMFGRKHGRHRNKTTARYGP